MSKEVVMTGATGFIGREVSARLMKRGWSVIGLSRNAQRPGRWLQLGSDEAQREITRVGKVINLAGAHPFEKRWSDSYKRQMFESRVGTTKRIVEALARSKVHERVLLNASGVGYYADCGEALVSEEHAPGRDGFLTDMIINWEKSASAATANGVRVCLMRTGLSFGPGGGPLAQVEPNFRRGVGGHIGNGQQFVPWIESGDMAEMFICALEQPSWSGPYNGAAPEPLRMRDLMRLLGAAMGRRSWMHMPGWAAQLAMGEVASLLLDSCRAQPVRALANGFQFRHSRFEDALATIFPAQAVAA